MFDLELEWTVGVGAGGRAKIFTPPPLRLSLFLTDDYPLFFSPLSLTAI